MTEVRLKTLNYMLTYQEYLYHRKTSHKDGAAAKILMNVLFVCLSQWQVQRVHV